MSAIINKIDQSCERSIELNDQLHACMSELYLCRKAYDLLCRFDEYLVDQSTKTGPRPISHFFPEVQDELDQACLVERAGGELPEGWSIPDDTESLREYLVFLWPYKSHLLDREYARSQIEALRSNVKAAHTCMQRVGELLTSDVARLIRRSCTTSRHFVITVGGWTATDTICQSALYKVAQIALSQFVDDEGEVVSSEQFEALLPTLPSSEYYEMFAPAGEIQGQLEDEWRQTSSYLENQVTLQTTNQVPSQSDAGGLREFAQLPSHEQKQFTRDLFLYSERLKGETWENLRQQLDSNDQKWDKLSTTGSVHSAVMNFAKRYNLPLPRKGKGGAPKK